MVHCFAAKVFLLQCFWGFDDAVGAMTQQAYETFLVEVGIGGNVFNWDIKKYGCLVTDGT